MSISKELQVGKAGEHFVCTSLITQGYNAFLADQGLNYDVVVDVNGQLKRLQVKTTQKTINAGEAKNIYRFGLRVGKQSDRRIVIYDVDYFAFVVLDILKVAYLSTTQLLNTNGKIKTIIDFRSRTQPNPTTTYSSGKVVVWQNKSKYIEYFEIFNNTNIEEGSNDTISQQKI